MNKRYWFIVLTYILMYFSGFVGVPLFLAIGVPKEKILALWNCLSFSIALIIILILLIPDMKERHFVRGRSTRSTAFLWAILGIFMAFGAQYIAAIIEMQIFRIEPGSENTADIVELAKTVPAFMIIVAIVGPILEEIVFRMIIFGALYKRFNFWIAAIISSLIFAVVHFDFEHMLIYTAIGITFAFLYVKTKRILVPICAHVAMNSFVMIVQVIFGEKIQELLELLEQSEQTLGGLISCVFLL